MPQGSQVPSTVFALVVVIVIVFVTKFLLLTFISFWTEENVISNLNNILQLDLIYGMGRSTLLGAFHRSKDYMINPPG